MGPLISARQQARGAGLPRRGRRSRSPGDTRRGRLLGAAERGRHRRPVGARIWREEVFGPVVAVMPFDDEAHAVALANDSEYGLSGSIFTRDLGRGLRVARAVESGNLSVNSHSAVRYWTPFGGYKQSGLGRELGPDAPARVHRGEERLHRPLTRSRTAIGTARAPQPPKDTHHGRTPPGQGRRHHRGLLRDRAGDRPALRRGGREGRHRRHRRASAATSSSASSAGRRGDVRDGRRDQQGRGRRAVPDRQGHLRLGRHRLQQRRASRRRRTTRSSTPTSRPGAGCRRST